MEITFSLQARPIELTGFADTNNGLEWYFKLTR